MRPTLIAVLAVFAAAAGHAADAPAPRSLRLAEAITLSASSLPVAIAGLQADIERANRRAEGTALLPNLDAVGSFTRGNTYQTLNDEPLSFTPENTVAGRLRLGQAILDANAWERTGAAGHRVAVAEAGRRLALEHAASDAAEAYVTLATALRLTDIRHQDLRLADELLTLARDQVKAGAVEALAATRAETRRASAQTGVIAAEGAIEQSSILLARALALDPALTLRPSDSLGPELGGSAAPTEATAAATFAHDHRPDMQVAAETLAASEADWRAARGAQLPRLGVFADLGRAGPRFDDTVTTWQVGVGLTIPLLNGNHDRAQAAHLAVSQEQLRRRDLSQRIDAEARSAAVAVATARAQLTASNEQRRLAELEVQQARERFAAGVTGNLELIEAQSSLARAGDQLVGAEQGLALARIRLAQAVGLAIAVK